MKKEGTNKMYYYYYYYPLLNEYFLQLTLLPDPDERS